MVHAKNQYRNLKENNLKLLLLLLSLSVVSLGQPAWLPQLGPIAAAMGYTLYWESIRHISSRHKQFWLSTIWFALVQALQLSWMTSIEYQGFYILGVYLFLAIALGLQFGLLSLLVLKDTPWNLFRVLATAGFWTLLEWLRFHTLCGFSWNTSGLYLASFPLGMQLAAIFGSLGLSFWVMGTNLLGVYASYKKFSRKSLLLWGACAILPYAYGTLATSYHATLAKNYPKVKAVLVQPGLLPSEKVPLEGRHDEFVSPWQQWLDICKFLHVHKEKKAELIALPEAAVPFRVDQAVYDYNHARGLLIEEFGKVALKFFPKLTPPFSEQGKVSNAFFCQFLANYFQADVIIGLDDEEGAEYYTAAHHFSPWQDKVGRYEKRVLLPLAEYMPFKWCETLSQSYGIVSFYTPGKEAKVFDGFLPISASICYEETFPDLIREGRLKGAAAFVNITNDNWYPNSKLPKQHFDHGKLRAIENGVPLFRACNSGVTTAVDSIGRVCGQLEVAKGALFVEVPNYQIKTIYTYFGDSLIVGISLGFIFFYLVYRRIEKHYKPKTIKIKTRK